MDPVDSSIPDKPQAWNKYSYAIANPLRFVDPDGREIRVAESAQSIVDEGMASRRFEVIFTVLDVLPVSVVDLSVRVGLSTPEAGIRAETLLFLRREGEGGRVLGLSGEIVIPARASERAVLLGHELAHDLEIITTGQSPSEIPGAREIRKGKFETKQAVADERTIRTELRAARKADKASAKADRRARRRFKRDRE